MNLLPTDLATNLQTNALTNLATNFAEQFLASADVSYPNELTASQQNTYNQLVNIDEANHKANQRNNVLNQVNAALNSANDTANSTNAATNVQIASLNSQESEAEDQKLNIFVGDLSTKSYINVSIGALTAQGLLTDNPSGTVADLTQSMTPESRTQTGSTLALTQLKGALNTVAIMRGSIGAGMNRLQAAINVIQTQSQNTLSAESTIRDANMAEEISNLTKFQILAQTGIAALAQANANSQNVLGLLR